MDSEFEDYDTVSAFYDKWRVPIGLDSLEQALETASRSVGTPKSNLKLLDVGCGTGNYIAMLKSKVGSCTGLEVNEGMLRTAIAKHRGDDRVTLHKGSAVDMASFESGTFDIVIITQVLHHLTMEMQNKTLVNVHSVLKKDGVLWISTVTPIQTIDGVWFNGLIPQAAASSGSKIPGLPLLKQQLAKTGLKIVSIDYPNETLVPKDKYLDIEGPFSEDYRKFDSTWSLSSKEELEAGLAWWREQIELGKAEEFIKMREKRRVEVGQTIAVTCVQCPPAC